MNPVDGGAGTKELEKYSHTHWLQGAVERNFRNLGVLVAPGERRVFEEQQQAQKINNS